MHYINTQDLIELLNDHKLDTILFGTVVIYKEENNKLINALISTKKTLILDGEAITQNILSSSDNINDLLLTPHEGEYRRAFGSINTNKLTDAHAISTRMNCTILLKGTDSLVTNKNGTIMQDSAACPFLATAETGDILAGICGAFMSQGINSYFAAAIGMWLITSCASKIGYGLIAKDIPNVPPPDILKQTTNSA